MRARTSDLLVLEGGRGEPVGLDLEDDVGVLAREQHAPHLLVGVPVQLAIQPDARALELGVRDQVAPAPGTGGFEEKRGSCVGIVVGRQKKLCWPLGCCFP